LESRNYSDVRDIQDKDERAKVRKAEHKSLN